MRTYPPAAPTSEVSNLFSYVPGDLPEEIVENLVQRGPFRVERILSEGHTTAPDTWLDQETDEWVLVVTGRGVLRFEDQADLVEMDEGDHLFIAAHRRHRVEWTAPNRPTIWIAVHIPPVS